MGAVGGMAIDTEKNDTRDDERPPGMAAVAVATAINTGHNFETDCVSHQWALRMKTDASC
jgi:hypothetical protein